MALTSSSTAVALLLMVGCLAIFFPAGGLASAQNPQFPVGEGKLPNPIQGTRIKPDDFKDVFVCLKALPALGGCGLDVFKILMGGWRGQQISLSKNCCIAIFNITAECKLAMLGINPNFTALVLEACAGGAAAPAPASN